MNPQDEDDKAPHAADTPSPDPDSGLSGTEQRLVRLSFWQTVLSVVGVFIAVLALYAALTESQAVRQQTAAAVWPFVQLSVEDYDTGDRAGFMLSVTNSGVGPALVRSVRVVLDGQAMRDWEQVVTQLGGELNEQVGRSTLSDRVLSPGVRRDLITVTDQNLARQFQAMIANPENSISYCYCSIFDECWVADSRRQALDPTTVQSCPDYGDEAFQN
ncbi:MAG TPA: hypothetical protein DEG76_13100 [Pseudohongiella sp.]|nr:hypothetical protein [Pseudohongiella sp.]MAY54710.1 hypothetical protein [Gammaproteobacteria bacterium]HBN14081.1 hypothetical protein [Pseudohongiella sp.]HBX38161.1 hypothetical protein [Pseudohongiella sp.]